MSEAHRLDVDGGQAARHTKTANELVQRCPGRHIALSHALDSAAVLQTYSRLVIDCNRGHGVDSSIPTVSETTAIPGNRDVPPDQRTARQSEIFVPYHARIRELLERA